MGRPQRGANAAVDAPVRPRRWVVALPLLLLLAACSGSGPQTTLDPAGPIAEEIDQLWLLVFWIAVVVFVLVEAALVISIFRFRERPGDERRPKQLHGNTRLEIIWTIIPAVLLAGLSVPMLATLFNIREVPEGPDVLTIQVIGHQWWWEFRYPESGVVTANEMHVPQGRTVVLSMTSEDVIHSFWVPKLGGKRDVIPGRTTRIVFTPDSIGEVYGQCAEFCGESHANMRFRVMVDTPEAFAAWVDRQRQPAPPADSLDEQQRLGAQVYMSKGCLACHAIQGVSAGVLGPDLTHVGSRTTVASGILPNTAEGLARWLRNPPAEKPGSLMPMVPMTDDEIGALVAYLLRLN